MWQNSTNYFQVMTIKTLLAPKTIYYWAAQLWTLFIVILCLMDGSSFPHVSVKGADKYVHFSLHFVFAFLWLMYFLKKGTASKRATVWVFFGSLFLGIALEFCQAFFTTTRKADVFDVLFNTLGAISALSTTQMGIYFSKQTR